MILNFNEDFYDEIPLNYTSLQLYQNDTNFSLIPNYF